MTLHCPAHADASVRLGEVIACTSRAVAAIPAQADADCWLGALKKWSTLGMGGCWCSPILDCGALTPCRNLKQGALFWCQKIGFPEPEPPADPAAVSESLSSQTFEWDLNMFTSEYT
eukprot:1084903-Rhodomonas_salina.1